MVLNLFKFTKKDLASMAILMLSLIILGLPGDLDWKRLLIGCGVLGWWKGRGF